MQAIVQHPEHGRYYRDDHFARGRGLQECIDLVAENQDAQGFLVCEVGAGTGGFTQQVQTLVG